MSQSPSDRAPVIALTHGGGPLPLLNDPGHASLIKTLKTKAPPLLKLATTQQPKAIVLVTAHWETPTVTISSAAKPDMLYDYGGFPPETYEYKYPAPGSPEVAQQVSKALKEAGIQSKMDEHRGWDHGVFVPMLLIHPEGTVPIVQVSVLSSQNPKDLYAIGRALAPLREHNIAIIGSGSASFHNIRKMFSGESGTEKFRKTHARFNDKLKETLEARDGEGRGRALEGWKAWEGAMDMHPQGRTEHFSPLIVCAGAAGDVDVDGEGKGKAGVWEDEMMGIGMRGFYWV
ncbi:MAG: hypothetical protein MMC33_001794 [Icmadophila ericetorum]|nr:hypothetical protein [Icmadophila ericetorum]